MQNEGMQKSMQKNERKKIANVLLCYPTDSGGENRDR